MTEFPEQCTGCELEEQCLNLKREVEGREKCTYHELEDVIPVRVVKIRGPIWKNRSVGIDENVIDCALQVEILYPNIESKDRLYPKPFFISKEDALTYPVQIVKGVRLRVIPIVDMARDLKSIKQKVLV